MPAYSRDSGEWTNTVARQRSDAAWTGDDALGYVHNGGDWVQFQAPAGDSVLYQPEDLVATPGDIDASFTWSNPTPAASATPTHIQFRLPETTTVWTEITYPATSTDVAYLTTATEYQFQCRYIERVDGSISRTGPITEVFFTTLAIDGPGEPAADPGGSGGDSSTDWPLPTGGGGSGPWTVGGAGCWWEYTIQTWDYATGFSDSVLIANVEVDGDIGALTYNWVTEGFSCDDVLRWKYREVCNSVPGDWQYGYPWTVVCSYDDPCGGASQTTKFASAPFDDVDCVFAMPKMCWNSETFKNEIIDYVAADVTYGKLSGFAVPLYIGGAWELVADSGLSVYGEPICAGHVPGLVPLGSSVPSLTSDFSVAGSFYLDTIPSAGSGAPVKILEIGKTVKLYAYASGSSWTVSAGFPMEGGGRFTLTGTTLLAADEFHHIGVTIDQDGSKILYVNGAVEVTDTDTTRADFGDLNGDVELRGNDNAKIKTVGGWGRVLSAAEMSALSIDLEPFTGTWEVAQVNHSTSAWTAKDYYTHINAPVGDLTVTATGGSGRGGQLGGKVVTDRSFTNGEALYYYVGESTTLSYHDGGYPGGGQGLNGTAFTQAGGGGGWTGFLATRYETFTLESQGVIIAGASPGDPNGAGGGLNGGGHAGTADAQLPNNPGPTTAQGGSTIAGYGGYNGYGASPGTLGSGGDGDGNSDSAGGGGGFYGGAGQSSSPNTSLAPGGGSSYVDDQCSNTTYSLAASTSTYGELILTGDLGIPSTASQQIANGADAVWPGWDPIGREYKDVSGNGHHAAPTTTVYPCWVAARSPGPDGIYYAVNPPGDGYAVIQNPPPVVQNRKDCHQSSTSPKVPAAGAGTGFYAEVFGCRLGDRPTTSTAAYMGFASTTTLGSMGCRISPSDGGDHIYFPGGSKFSMTTWDTVDVWHHIAIRLDASDNSYLYIDGVEVATGTWAGAAETLPFGPFCSYNGSFLVSNHNFAWANCAVWGSDPGSGQPALSMAAFGI